MANICPARHAVAFVDGRAQGPVGGTICVYSNTKSRTHCYLQYLQLPTSTSNCLPPPPIVYLQLRVRIVGRGARIVGHATFAPTSRSAWARKRLMRGGTDTRLWFPRAPVSLCEGARLRSGWELLFLRAPFHLVSCWLVCCKSVAKSIWMSAFDAGRMLLLVNQALLFS
jgi:hypothetical protein